MIDFRYHAISIVAVFLALAIGILLGVTIGDSLVSEAEQGLRGSLQEDVVEARASSDAANERVADQDRLIDAMLPLVAGDRLRRQRIAVVAVGAIPEALEASIRSTVDVAGGEVDSVAILPAPPETAALADALAGELDAEPGEQVGLARLGRRIAKAIVAGGPLADRLQAELPDRFAGDYLGADTVVFHATLPAEDADGEPPVDLFASAVLAGLVDTDAIAVGVEASDTDPSQIPFYARRDIATVDSVDLPGGQAGLVLALDGAAGNFGFKETADELLPGAPND